MARPRNCRRVGSMPGSSYFKPRGIPLSTLEEVVLSVDEFEAIRLADLEGLYQEQAAERMKVSRQTFGRIVETARRKVAKALVEGKALKIEGGEVEMASMRRFRCEGCNHAWEIPYGTGKPGSCPACESGNVRRAEEDRGSGAGPGRGRGRCCRGPKRNEQQ
jgi:uncharacterized protein